MVAAALLILALGCQDDVARLLEKLGSDEYADRESAQRALEQMGPPVLDRLKAEADRVQELDTRLRLKTLIEKIPRLAKLALVYGPTKRVSLSVRDAKLGDVFRQMETALGEQFVGEGVDLATPVTLDLESATLWEALDALARASHTHYFYRKEHVAFAPGEAARLPVLYYNQFRISVVEVKRVEYRAPGMKDHLAVVVPEVRFQRNLSPAGNKYIHIFSEVVLTRKDGSDAKAAQPTWAYHTLANRRTFGMQEFYFVDAGSGAVSLSGRATINFAQEDREVVIPLVAEIKQTDTADGMFRVTSVTTTEEGTVVSLELDQAEGKDLKERMTAAWLHTGDQKRHLGKIGPATRDGKLAKREIRFASGLKDVKALSFHWVSGLHAVEIPFTLSDIRIP